MMKMMMKNKLLSKQEKILIKRKASKDWYAKQLIKNEIIKELNRGENDCFLGYFDYPEYKYNYDEE